ncbi:Nodulation protein noeE [Sulfitobacter noctilucae]|uniref:sulfotransferase family protein n=1 Tax=Sulfitobacter noctilucae TaxID=1342302 RepID=UPI0004686414|nr:sulfotransferase [Sulfitobacter noctilucae]KIN70585.1 Nodulation protein noeE [Sulfitobacter noctilucae]
MTSHRYVFVGGLHRSGTSLVARLIGELPGVSAINQAPVPENEGVYLQGAIPHTAQHGIPMHFATDPAQHHIEGSHFDSLETQTRLDRSWAPYFKEAPWRVEKSPVNLTRMRLYQQLFPLSQFVVVIRHPEAVAAATSKWVAMDHGAMMDHWLDAHDIVWRDLDYLHAVITVRYEDLVANPEATLARLAAFLDVDPVATPSDIRDGNQEYVDTTALSVSQAKRASVWGYGAGLRVQTFRDVARHPLRRITEKIEAASRHQIGRSA